MNNTAIILISASSLPLAWRIKQMLPSAIIYSKSAAEGEEITVGTLEAIVKDAFTKSDALIFIGAMGICVRSIAPYVNDKYTDPAVVCIDSTGKYVVSVLSGHIGGANELTNNLARLLNAEPVVTTQSDNTNLWALDTWEKKYGWIPFAESGGMVFLPEDGKKCMNDCITAFVNRKPTALLLDHEDMNTEEIKRTCPAHVRIFHKLEEINFNDFELLLAVTPRLYHFLPIRHVFFHPPVLHLGIGCQKGRSISADTLYGDISMILMEHGLSIYSIKDINSIDLKKEEPALKELSQVAKLPFITYPAEELNLIPIPNPSEKVKQVTGSSSVSEAAAIMAAKGGKLLVEKRQEDYDGFKYTVAVAIDKPFQLKGHIEIVGAGPGDPELISIRGRKMLEKADLILYAGSLVPKELTECAKKSATVRSSADMNLEEQFALMKDFYDKGQFVVRLHTGDPCIYGAIQEQMNYFDQYGMDYHITPGISSFQAAAAALCSQFTIPEKVQTIILTRGEGRTPMPEKEQLHKLATSQSTMCIYLSAGVVDQVQEELLQHYPPTTPVAACYKLTWKDERIYRGELKDLAKLVKDNNLTLTTLLVVGDAIDNRQGLSRLYADEFKHLFRK